jgi:ZIP Zinc transporter
MILHGLECLLSFLATTGIGIGTLLTSGANADNLQVPNVVLQGLATGTLLYVVFFEILSKDRSGFTPYLSVCGGFLLMFGLQYIGEFVILENFFRRMKVKFKRRLDFLKKIAKLF